MDAFIAFHYLLNSAQQITEGEGHYGVAIPLKREANNSTYLSEMNCAISALNPSCELPCNPSPLQLLKINSGCATD